MRKIFHILSFVVIFTSLFTPFDANGREFNDKLLNKPYADLRRWHLGFSVGLHTKDLNFTTNGYVTENGESWFVEQPDFAPGFCVNGLIDLRLNEYFNTRFTPGMYFGTYDIQMREANTGATERQTIKTANIVFPLDLKFSSVRYRNARPYLVGGAMASVDIAKRRSDFIKLKTTDFYLTFGFGCDFYLPYFKFNPEIKFCFGLNDVLETNRPDLKDEPDKLKFTQSLSKATTQMVVLTFYFE